jgi:hypothetical protein
MFSLKMQYKEQSYIDLKFVHNKYNKKIILYSQNIHFLVSPGPSCEDDNLYHQFTVEDMKSCILMNVVNTSDSDNNNNNNNNSDNENNKQSTTPTQNDATQKRNIVRYYDDMATFQINKSKGLCSIEASFVKIFSPNMQLF